MLFNQCCTHQLSVLSGVVFTYRSVSMAFVVRISAAGERRSWCTSRPSRGGSLELVPLALTFDTVVLASVAEFGDLRSYVMLSQASSGMHRPLAASITVVRNQHRNYFLTSPTPLGLCSWCSGYGDDLGYAHGSRCFSCDLCQESVCEHCVVLASFCGDGVQPITWVCAGHQSEGDPVATVVPIRWWLFCDVVDARMQDVYRDYDFDFFFQIMALSGEVVRNELDCPCAVLKSSWKSSFRRVWAAVHHVTGGRLRQLVLEDMSFDNYSRYDGFRWSRYLEQSDARACSEDSPFHVSVVLGGF